VHYSSIIGEGFVTLNPDEIVDVEYIKGDKGYHALKVKRNYNK